jgi:iron complex outermembrane receptor protein
MKSRNNQLRHAIRCLLGGGAVAALAATGAPVLAQGEAAEEPIIERIAVTGTRIQRTAIDGPSPVTIFGREDIDAGGDVSVADFLNRSNFNSFGSFTPASGFAGGAQGQAELSLRGLGSGRTLVLVDGRRISNTPAFAGAAQNINALPLALVERIEVLTDGASAIYGTDAIGGVVNVITRQEYEGLDISGQIERPTQSGADSHQYSVVFGVGNERGNLTMSYEHYERDILFRRDRDYLFAQEPSPLGGPGSFYRVADRAAPVAGFIPSPNLPGAVVEPFADCPDAFDGPDHPSSARASFPLITGADELCLYRFTDDAGQTASTDRDSVTVNARYDITDDVEVFARTSFMRNKSFGRFAAAPVTPVLGGLTMAADNVFNPTAGEADGPHDIVMLFRPVAGGPRDSEVEDKVVEALIGLRGQFGARGENDWEVALFQNRYTQSDIGINYGLRTNLQGLVDNEVLDPFNPDPATFGAFAHTIVNNNEFVAYGFDFNLSFDDVLGNMDFRLPLVIGGEYREEEFKALVDQQSEAGNVFGSAGSTATGDRDYWAIYAETLIPFADDRAELSLALRYDRYSDFGGELSPKIALSFRPIEELVLRASYSEGFAAPSLEILNRLPSQGFPSSIDRLGCFINPDNAFACDSRQRETFSGSNPDLQAELSEQWSLGMVYRPTDNLWFTLDYFNIEIDDGIGTLTSQNVLDNELRCFQEGRACDPTQEGSVERTAPADQGGQVVQINAPAANFTVNETDGFDGTANWQTFTDMGMFGLQANITYTRSFKRATAPMAPLEEVLQAVANPKWRGQLRGTWSMDRLSANAVINHIPKTDDCSIAKRNEDPRSPDCQRTMGRFTTVDVQFGYNTPWGGDLVIGARNLFNKNPPLSQELGVPAAPETDQGLYSIFGRVPYLRYSHSF